MGYTRTELESIGEAFTASSLLEWSGRILAAAHQDAERLARRGLSQAYLDSIEVARVDVAQCRELRKRERHGDPALAKVRRRAIEDAVDWRLELRGLAQAVFDTRPEVLKEFRTGVKTSRSVPLLAAEIAALLAVVRSHLEDLRPAGISDDFILRGTEILQRLSEAGTRLEEERSLTSGAALNLNHAKGVLYTRVRYLCRIARVEFRREPSRASLYGYGLLRGVAARANLRVG